MLNGLQKYSDLGMLVLRLGFGIVFIVYHGWGKITGGPERWAGLGGSMSNFGIEFGHTFFGFMAAFAESFGVLCIILGLFFRPMSLILGFTMLVASVQHMVSGQGTPAHAMKNMFVLLGLAAVGPGKYSLDAMLSKSKEKESVAA